jgi:hypothetical protein
VAAGVAWGAVLLLCVAIFSPEKLREHAVDQIIAAREKYEADRAKLPADSTLWDWVPFLETRDHWPNCGSY